MIPTSLLAVLLVLHLDFLHVYFPALKSDLSSDKTYHAPKNGRVDEIANWLKLRLNEGETVQPLDWVEGGTIHAMLLAEAKISTTFMYDFWFYHHVSSLYVQEMRKSFISQLQKSPPRFFIAAKGIRRASGSDTSQEYPELERFMLNYSVVKETAEYRIYERNE